MGVGKRPAIFSHKACIATTMLSGGFPKKWAGDRLERKGEVSDDDSIAVVLGYWC